MLKVQNLAAAYSGIQALRDVSLEVEAGECVALVGTNGAGKSTLLNCLSGVVKPRSGEVLFRGVTVQGRPPYWIARRGLIQVPEGRQILGELTVYENLVLGELARGQRGATHGVQDIYNLFPRLKERQDQVAGSLSGGEQQMLAIGRALMGAPQLLLLDEPSLGLSPLMTDVVFDALQALNKDGLTILLVEQNATLAFNITHRAYVLDRGKVSHQGLSRQMAEDPEIIRHYLGAAAGNAKKSVVWPKDTAV